MMFYQFPISTYSQKVLIALAEKGIECATEEVMLFDADQRAAYREIYPLGKIPLLVLDDGHMIPESSIIVEYLDTHFDGGTRLIPADPDEAREVRFQDRMLDLYLNEPVTTLLFQSWKPEDERDPERIERARETLAAIYRFMNGNLAKNTWSNGDAFTMADCAAAPPLSYAREVAPFDEHANIVAYYQRLCSRDSYAGVAAAGKPYLESMRPAAV